MMETIKPARGTEGRPDLWGEEREWETQYGPGELLDGWRHASRVLEGVARMNENGGAESEMLYIALTDALKNARIEAAHFEEEVRMRLSWNKAHGRLTPFGRVLKPMMDRAGYETAAQLLFAAGKMEEPNAVEILERLMYGPATLHNLGGYLEGFSEALGLPENDGGRAQQMRLSSTLMHFAHPDLAEKVAREAEAEAEADYMPPPSPDAAGPLSDANAALSDDTAKRTPATD